MPALSAGVPGHEPEPRDEAFAAIVEERPRDLLALLSRGDRQIDDRELRGTAKRPARDRRGRREGRVGRGAALRRLDDHARERVKAPDRDVADRDLGVERHVELAQDVRPLGV